VDTSVLIVPGLRGSGPAHWQSLWQAGHPEYVRVVQADWDTPRLADWTAALDAAIRTARRPAFLVAHSFGCLAAIRRLTEKNHDVAGALLAAPADPQRFRLDAELPAQPLGVPAYLVASENDPWLDYDQAARLARRFGCTLVNAGAAGHLNAESGYGPWPKGERLLRKLQHEHEKKERTLQVALAFGS
jgi:predicted alpha/beta hydrolase family esterase